jgi:hypothetical protein
VLGMVSLSLRLESGVSEAAPRGFALTGRLSSTCSRRKSGTRLLVLLVTRWVGIMDENVLEAELQVLVRTPWGGVERNG